MLRQQAKRTDSRYKLISARVSDDEKQVVEIRRKQLGMTEADYIRYCINKEMEEDK